MNTLKPKTILKHTRLWNWTKSPISVLMVEYTLAHSPMRFNIMFGYVFQVAPNWVYNPVATFASSSVWIILSVPRSCILNPLTVYCHRISIVNQTPRSRWGAETGVGDRTRTCMVRICNPLPHRSATHPHITICFADALFAVLMRNSLELPQLYTQLLRLATHGLHQQNKWYSVWESNPSY